MNSTNKNTSIKAESFFNKLNLLENILYFLEISQNFLVFYIIFSNFIELMSMCFNSFKNYYHNYTYIYIFLVKIIKICLTSLQYFQMF